MLTLIPCFVRALAIGFCFSVIWEIHKIGKIALIVLFFISTVVVFLYPAEFYASFNSWEYELANFIGLIFGSVMGRWTVNDITS